MTVQAIVLRAADYKDYDRILTLFAFGHGQITTAARACRRIKSPLLNVAVPFVAGEFVLTERQGRYTVKSCHVDQAHYPLRQDALRLAHASFIAALCEEIVQPGLPADTLFTLLLQALANLAFHEARPEAVSIPFIIRLLDEQGFGPILTRCGVCGREASPPRFAPNSMGVVCPLCGPHDKPVSPKAVQILEEARLGAFSPLTCGSSWEVGEAFTLISEYAQARLEKNFRAYDMIRRLTSV